MSKPTLSVAAVFLALTLLLAGTSPAQQPKGSHGSMMGHEMGNDNMKMMSNMMQHMHQMMGQGKMNAEHQKQMADIMAKMSKVMSEMHGPDATKLQEQHHKQLQDLDKQLNNMPK